MTGLCQGGSRLVQILQCPQARLLVGFFGIAEQVVQEDLQHFQNIILSRRFEAVDKGRERGQAASGWHAADGLSLGAVGEARQGRDPARRNAGLHRYGD